MKNHFLNNKESQAFKGFDSLFHDLIINRWVAEERHPEYAEIPEEIHPSLKKALSIMGIEALYKHQKEAIDLIEQKKDVLISTGTSSGKSLCYQIPIVGSILSGENATSLLIYPTKALTDDQFKKFQIFIKGFSEREELHSSFVPAVYDGDTLSSQRIAIRKNVSILLTNPDMLHLAILPHHTLWSEFLARLKFVVVDEVHVYRGVIGSHLANIFRRLNRILRFYGANPQYILASATISNPKEFGERLLGKNIEVIENDYSYQPQRNYYFLNPPVLDSSLGIRKSLIQQTNEVAEHLLAQNIQTIFFARTRRTVEQTLKFMKRGQKNTNNVQGYRSGYLSKERREIENGLRNGKLRAVISTNALELGIDMGKVDAVVLMGYPGTIAAFHQQTGRAGRQNRPSAAILIASGLPLDQFIIRNREYITGRNPENALIDPDNPLILLNHIRCALFELPFDGEENYGDLDFYKTKQYLEVLKDARVARKNGEKYFFTSDAYPANEISIRNIGKNPIILREILGASIQTIGEVDFQSALKMVHPGAIYIHNGAFFFVKDLILEKQTAYLIPHDEDYFTEPLVEITIEIEQSLTAKNFSKFSCHFDEILVTENIKGFKKIDWQTREIIGREDLDLPENILLTKSFWISLNELFVESLRITNRWRNDPIDYGPDWAARRVQAIKRDQCICQFCGLYLELSEIHVHHRIPFRAFHSSLEANRIENLVSLCTRCHQKAEQNVRIRSGLSGLAYLFSNIAPLHLMCDNRDIGYFSDSAAKWNHGLPAMGIFDQYPGGIGLSAKLFDISKNVFSDCRKIVQQCECTDGCPSCVGPPGENGLGGKEYTIAILKKILE